MDYEGGDLLLAGATCGRFLGTAQAMAGDLNKRPGGPVSVTKCALEVSCT